ncbi:hypothetical protein WMY93_011774 [Mugilogobius chulae]|uniref:Uncharacterized protein n=1 Tax=Mugilogobius chulae TaxID=88201 RepID=A0AAW0PFM8_9GOBI
MYVAAELPQLTALVLCGYRQRGHKCGHMCFVDESLCSERHEDSLMCFPLLQRLYLRQCALSASLYRFLERVPRQLTHLRICIVRKLPRLQHLSLSMDDEFEHFELDERFVTQTHDLRSLELVNCFVYNLYRDTMKLFPRLEKLSLFFSPKNQNLRCSHLNQWLQDVPALRCLLLHNAPPLSHFVGSLGSSVTSLSLTLTQISPDQIQALSQRLPDLLHLHLEASRPPVGPDTALLPALFPKLQSLRVSLRDVPEEAVLSLLELQDLLLLEIQDLTPPPAGLDRRLQELSQNRVRVRVRPEPETAWSCSCVGYVDQDWDRV